MRKLSIGQNWVWMTQPNGITSGGQDFILVDRNRFGKQKVKLAIIIISWFCLKVMVRWMWRNRRFSFAVFKAFRVIHRPWILWVYWTNTKPVFDSKHCGQIRHMELWSRHLELVRVFWGDCAILRFFGLGSFWQRDWRSSFLWAGTMRWPPCTHCTDHGGLP